ncbi:MAG: cache domain-containing protein [Pseudomonadota bacterium]
MYRSMKMPLAAAAVMLLAALPALAEPANRTAAVALAERAVGHVKKVGVQAACKDFANKDGEFIQGELYVFVQDSRSVMICHGINARINGKDVSEQKDINGKQFAKELTTLVMAQGSGWTDYVFVNPVTQKLEAKSTFGKKIDDLTWLGVGTYRKDK